MRQMGQEWLALQSARQGEQRVLQSRLYFGFLVRLVSC